MCTVKHVLMRKMFTNGVKHEFAIKSLNRKDSLSSGNTDSSVNKKVMNCAIQ